MIRCYDLVGHKMIDDVERLMESALVDLATGMHNPEVQEPPPLTPSTLEEVLLKEPMLFDENGDNGRCGLGVWFVVVRNATSSAY